MKLYYSPGACSLAAHIVAEEAGLALDYERVDLKAHKTEKGEDFASINPKNYVPFLKLDDGSSLSENVAILQYLGDRKPDAGLVPAATSHERYRLQEWLAFINSEVHKAFSPVFGTGSDEVKAQARERVLNRLGFIDKTLSGKSFLMGENFSVADAYLTVVLGWCDAVKLDLSALKNIVAYKDRVNARPAVTAARKAEGLIK